MVVPAVGVRVALLDEALGAAHLECVPGVVLPEDEENGDSGKAGGQIGSEEEKDDE